MFPPAFVGCNLACASVCLACNAICADKYRANCFSDNMTVFEVLSNVTIPRNIQEVQPGARLLTMMDDQPEVTLVVSNHRALGRFEYITMDMETASGKQLQVSVTDGHHMVVVRNATLKTLQAANVVVGDTMRGLFGVPEDVVVQKVQKKQMTHKNELITDRGTVMVNGLLVTTICEEPRFAAYSDYRTALRVWHASHSGFHSLV